MQEKICDLLKSALIGVFDN